MKKIMVMVLMSMAIVTGVTGCGISESTTGSNTGSLDLSYLLNNTTVESSVDDVVVDDVVVDETPSITEVETNNNDADFEGFILNPSYFDDDYFYQLNTKVYIPEMYKLDDFDRLVSNTSMYVVNNSIDTSHIATSYVAPVMEDGTSYMSIYDYTYVYSNDDLSAAFMSLMADDVTLRNQIMTSTEYSDLVSVYNQYVDDSTYDVNPYVYHYIVEYIDITYGDKLFDYDFYCETYPMLAVLFQYDEDALKQHFYSVGMFEGRQGIATFNVDNYTSDSDDFGTYYIQYVTTSDSSKSYSKTSSDVYQIRLYDVGFENYIADVVKDHESSTYLEDLASPYIQGELNALASDRIRYQLGDYVAYGHDLTTEFFTVYKNGLTTIGLTKTQLKKTAENIYVSPANNLTMLNDRRSQEMNNTMTRWRTCDSHYKAAINAKYLYVAQSHIYGDYNPYAGTSNNPGVAAKADRTFYTGCTVMFPETAVNCIDAVYDAK
ncbi:MAG: hypothetical protein KBS85_04540 [Lachnospiraceae bacterium]|nr:hypothetical protein [Candidatus Merdinaster equi]